MKINCLKDNLEKSLNIAERFTGKNINLPVLANVLIEAIGSYIKITATNLEYAVEIKIQGKIADPGKVSVPAKVINSLIQSIKEEKISLEEKSDNLVIKTEFKNTKINGNKTDEFPLIPNIKNNNCFKTEAMALKQGLEKVLSSASLSDFKPEFTGVFFNISSTELKLTATDTFRLAEQKIKLSDKPEKGNFSFILPSQVAQELVRIISYEKEIKIIYGDNQILFESGSFKITSRLIEGNFPEYENIIPKEFEITSFINRNELKDTIKAASIFSSKLMDISLDFDKDKLEIISSNQDVGEYKNIINIQTSQNKKLKVDFNYKYLLDGLNSLSDENIFMGCNTENNPSLFHNKTNDNFLYVLMPIRLN